MWLKIRRQLARWSKGPHLAELRVRREKLICAATEARRRHAAVAPIERELSGVVAEIMRIERYM